MRIDDGKIAFPTSSKPLVSDATQLNASFYNLTNVVDVEGKRDARFEGKALLLGDAPLEASGHLRPAEQFRGLRVPLARHRHPAQRMNDFASAYGKFDFKAGTATW